MTNFSVFRWQNWVILLNAVITVLNSFFLMLLSLKFKALLLLVCSQKAKVDLVFTLPPKATVATKTAAESVHELWQLIQTGVSEFVGNEVMLVIICLILLVLPVRGSSRLPLIMSSPHTVDFRCPLGKSITFVFRSFSSNRLFSRDYCNKYLSISSLYNVGLVID